MPFPPVAIVGRACLLPGARNPAELWSAVRAGRDLTGAAPEGRWRVDGSLVASPSTADAPDATWSDRGGYVEGFRFDPEGLALPAESLTGLDPVFLWALHVGREALRDAGHDPSRPEPRAGLVMGNLSFPSASLSRFAEATWLSAQAGALGPRAAARAGVAAPDPRNRFCSGLPAEVAAAALGLGQGGFALDAACASSLYALKLACDRLHDGAADLMLAGAVNSADDLFIHVGFSALKALSRSGQSRPFHREADGLLPAEGAAFLVLERLADAEAAGHRILGVVRGIGLSNDGRGAGFLAPAEAGQRRAMEAAYASAGLRPADVSLLECHATGTPVGDATEVRSTAEVFAGCRDVPVGSLKSNLGHLITAAGAAAVLKVLGAFEAGERPPTIHAEDPHPVLAGSPFRLLHELEPWPSDGPRRAAVSAFGFGGNDAHVILEQHEGRARPRRPEALRAEAPAPAVAVVALGARVAGGRDATDLACTVLGGEAPRHEAGGLSGALGEELELPLEGLRFPPRDLRQTLPQQLLVMEAAREAVSRCRELPRERTSVLVGMGCDAEIARYGTRWRLAGWARDWAAPAEPDPAWLARARDVVIPVLEAAGVVGTMPNIPANRLNSLLDLGGPSFTVSAEERSGLVALELAARALRAGEIDAALVGAVEVASDVHRAAAEAVLGPDRSLPGDAAVVLVLKRLEDARRDGEEVLALLPAAAPDEAPGLALGEGGLNLAPQLGHAHAASGLVHAAAAVLACSHAARPLGPGVEALPWLPVPGGRRATVRVRSLGGGSSAVGLRSADSPARPLLLQPPPRLHVFSGEDRAEVLEALRRGDEGDGGPARLVLVARDAEELAARRERAEAVLSDAAPPAPGVAFRERPIGGELAFVFSGPAGAYRGMGGSLLLAFPSLLDRLARGFPSLDLAAGWAFDLSRPEPRAVDRLWGSSLLAQAHASLSRDVLGLSPAATVGFCSGETNALYAMGAWEDVEGLWRGIQEAGVYDRELGGELRVVRRAWGEAGEVSWTSFRLLAPLDRVRAALAGEARVHLTIVNAPGDCVVGGEAAACARVVERVGRERARGLGYDLAVHCPEMAAYRDEYRALHHRPTRPVPGVRFYSQASLGHYQPTPDAAADALTNLALHAVDFPALVERAWADGVRVFLEHGPRGSCSRWIDRCLGEREHLAVPLDEAGHDPVEQAAFAVAELLAAGVAVDRDHFEAGLARAATRPAAPRGAVLRRRLHPEPLRLPPLAPAAPVARGDGDWDRSMPPAPPLPPVLAGTPPSRWSADGPGPPAPVAAPRPAPTPAARLAPRPPAVAPPAASPGTGLGPVLDGLLAFQRQVAAVHDAFLAEQATAHRRFLELQSRAAAELLRASGLAPDLQVETRQAPPGPRPAPSWPAAPLPPAKPLAAPAPAPAAAAPPAPAPAAVTAEAAAPDAVPGGRPRGPAFTRAQLEVLASGRVSSVFGPLFERQDGFRRQVRMPEPPLLLADRVLGIDGEAGTLGLGTIWTETGVREDGWYLHEGRMPAGIVIESGQADLLLISWLGIDFLNRGERVYRLLGCDLTYHGGLPRPGDTLRYDIHVDGHARQGDVRLFFFHYGCRVAGVPRLTVRGGQAGFFTDRELAESAGVLWDAATGEHRTDGPLDPPAVPHVRSRFGLGEVRAFSEGRTRECFGEGYELAETHVRTPRIAPGRMMLLGDVTDLDPRGGPWGRGYFRSVRPFSPGDWFFEGHFKDDPCMPGTLMFEGCLQAMAFYLTALGFTLERDGWTFEPVPDETYPLRCRGQAIPSSRELVYELFVEEVVAGPVPTLRADLLCTVDGLKAFHCRRMGLRLVPDWPLTSRPEVLHQPDERPIAVVDGFRYDHDSLLACAWGRPSDAFGPTFAVLDGPRRAPRLPGPPYHFMSRVARVVGPLGQRRAGVEADFEYDVPEDAWYFEEGGASTMPFCVFLEENLQPCGWIATATGVPLDSQEDLFFRNLDGTGTWRREVRPGGRRLRTRSRLTDVSTSAGMTIVSFDVDCALDGEPLYDLKTVFGFFPAAALANQVGLPTTDEDRARLVAPGEASLDIGPLSEDRPGTPRLPFGRLRVLDRVSAWWPTGGAAGLGRLRAEKDIRPDEWFFKAHFFQDPVQPGSLGLEAMLQLVRLYARERGLGDGMARPRFVPFVPGRSMTWKYRGQVIPSNRLVMVEAEITEVGRDERGTFVLADAWLWVDGRRIYSATSAGVSIVDGE